MSDPLDVSLRMRLERVGFQEGQRDVEELRRAADKLGQTRGADELGRDLAQAGKVAERTEKDIEELARAADRLGTNGGAERLGKNFGLAITKIDGVERAVRDVGRAIEAVDREKFDKLRSELATTTTKVGELERKLREAGRAKRPLEETSAAAGLLAGTAGRAFTAIAAFASVDQVISGLSRLEQGFRSVDRAAAQAALTAETYDPKVRQGLIDENKALGRTYGVEQAGIQGARQVFTAGGMSLEQQRAALPSTLRTAVGSGANPEVIAQAGRSVMESMGLTGADLAAAYDIIAKGGKLGAFEVEAQARNFPQIGAQMKALGIKGLSGVADTSAMMQIVRKNTGTEDEAATNLTNFLASITSPETISNFKDKRSNLPRILQEAQSKGENPVLAVVDEARRLTNGDPVKLGQLFGDQQAMNAARALIQNRGELDEMRTALRTQSAGTGERDYQYMQATPSGQADRRAAEREAAGVEIGEALNPGSAAVGRASTNAMRGAAHIAQGFNEGGAWEGIKRVLQAQSPLAWLWQSTNRGDQPSAEDIEARKAEAEQLAGEIARERAAIASSGRSRNWMAESRLSVKQNRYDELMGGLRTDLGAAEAGKAAGQSTAELETRIQSLTQAIRDLEKKLGDAGTGGLNPISFRSGDGQPRLWNASLGGRGGGVGGTGGGFRSAYSGGAPMMDGMANLPPGAGAAAGVGSPRGRVNVTGNPGGAAGEVYDVLSADFNDAQAMALLGHMQQESSFDPASWNAKEGAGGLLQWRGNRLENLKRFAAERGMNWQDRKVQAAFVGHEMRTDPYERRRSARFRSATTIEEASGALKDYVRFGDDSAGTRLANARGFAQQFGAKSVGDGVAGEVRRGSANYMRGQHGPPGSNLVTIQAPGGAKFQVHAAAAESFQGFVNELEAGGYAIDPKTSGGYNHRNKRGGGGLSQHAYGNAIDINWNRNPMGRQLVTDMPANVSDIAAKHGLSWGGDWKRTKDAMHFEWTGIKPGQDAIAAATGELPAGRLPKPTPRPATATEEPMPTTASLGRGRGAPTINLTQNIRGGFDARLAAERSMRQQHRAIRLAESGAMHDTMVQPA
ncbi:phage tail tape measure protein [Aureimonas sp. SK2]|uniref:phage tail tape measure protein n=1 Tax=Aureimonas sp. SK2 TaxID=3015992 RepID=UPI0024440C76|nr:phage tail tape measure protein [Aureimonas sp. SK2]